MTVQVPHTLLFNGEEFSLWSNPLHELLSRKKPRIEFSLVSTGMSQGYTADWELTDNRLWLVRIRGKLRDWDGDPLDRLFPTQQPPIFAEWFTGRLFVPYGRATPLAYTMYGCSYEQHMEIGVRTGVCRGINKEGGPLPSVDVHPWRLFKRHVASAWLVYNPGSYKRSSTD